jgi:hypothetical protein
MLVGEQAQMDQAATAEEDSENANTLSFDPASSNGNDTGSNNSGNNSYEPSSQFLKALKTLSKLVLVDLGGSENLQRSKAHESVKLAGGVISGGGEVRMSLNEEY